MSPKTRLIVFAIVIGIVVILFVILMDIPLSGFRAAMLVIVIAVVLYALLTKIADRLRQRKLSPKNFNAT